MDFNKLAALIVVGLGHLTADPESNIWWAQDLLSSPQGRVIAIAQKHLSWEVEVSESHGSSVYQGADIQFCRRKKHHVLCRIMVGGVDIAPIHAYKREL